MSTNRYTQVVYTILLAFVFTIPISTFVSTRLLVVTLLLSFFVKADVNYIERVLRRSWEVYLFFFVLAVGVSYSDDVGLAGRVLETSFSLAAIPLIISRFSFDEKRIKTIMSSFMLGCVVAGVVCIVNAAIRYNQTSDQSVFVFNELTAIINSHPTYLAYYLIFSLTVAFYWLYDNEPPFGKFVWLPVYIFFFVLLMLTGGHTAYISLLLIFSFFILKTITQEITRVKAFLLIVIVLMLGTMFMVNSLESAGQPQSELMNDYWERSPLWEAAIRANSNPLFGVGTGDYNIELKKYYVSHDLDQYAVESMNSHNQFIQVYLSNGLLGVVAIILLLTRPLIAAIKSGKSLTKLVFFPFFIYGMNEVFLGRYQGVVFFALLHQLFTVYNELSPSNGRVS